MTEEMLEVRAALNPDTNEPLYGTCTLSLGDGSVKVAFNNGRAVVARSIVERYLVQNGAIEVPALGIFRSRISDGGGAVVQSQDTVTATGTRSLEDMTPDERLKASEELAELIAKDQAEAEAGEQGPTDNAREEGRTSTAAEQDPGPKTTVDDTVVEGSVPQEEAEEPGVVEESEKQRRIREAREHLQAEGEEVPDPAPEESDRDVKPTGSRPARVVPAGFDDETSEGEPRCLAKKGDGSQCKNAAKDGGPACQLDAHVRQFAAK